MNLITNMRMTTTIKKEDIQLINSEIWVGHLNILCQHFPSENFESIYIYNNVIFKNDIENGNLGQQYSKLAIRGAALEVLHKQNQLQKLWSRLLNQKSLIYLSI